MTSIHQVLPTSIPRRTAAVQIPASGVAEQCTGMTIHTARTCHELDVSNVLPVAITEHTNQQLDYALARDGARTVNAEVLIGVELLGGRLF